jgi:hypothetical protein
MSARGQKVQRILLRIKKHLDSIQDYYSEEDFATSPIILGAIRREQENVVSLARQLMGYEDLFDKYVYGISDEDEDEDLPF